MYNFVLLCVHFWDRGSVYKCCPYQVDYLKTDYAVVYFCTDPQIRMLAHHWPVIVGVVSVTALLEAYTEQNDNLILGLFQFALLVTFC